MPAYSTLSTASPSTIGMFATPLAPAEKEAEPSAEPAAEPSEEVVEAAVLENAPPVEPEVAEAAPQTPEPVVVEDLPPPLDALDAEAAVEEEEEEEEVAVTEQPVEKPPIAPKPVVAAKPTVAPRNTATPEPADDQAKAPATPAKKPVPTPKPSTTPIKVALQTPQRDATPSKTTTIDTTDTSPTMRKVSTAGGDEQQKSRSARSLSAMFERQLNPPAKVGRGSTKSLIKKFEPVEEDTEQIVEVGRAKSIRAMFEPKPEPLVREGTVKHRHEFLARKAARAAEVQ